MPPPGEDVMGRPYHILLVDDKADVREILRRMILRLYPSTHISEASDSATALAIYKQQGVICCWLTTGCQV
jgi:CheY-like chemotaxis protein